MKLNKHGWGYKMMTFLMSILVIFLLIKVYFIYNYYNKVRGYNYIGNVMIGDVSR